MGSCGAPPVRCPTLCSAAAVAALLLCGCGGISAGTPDGGALPSPDAGAADAAAGTDATARVDAGVAPDAGAAGDAAADAAQTSLDAAADAITVSGVPVNHRPSPAACPQQRAVGAVDPTCQYDAGGPCLVDSQCNAGNNGRCFGAPPPRQTVPHIPPPPQCMGTSCDYDQCFTDSDCPGNDSTCLCRPDATSSNANVCVTGGNCRIDTDCGPGGFCSPASGSPSGLWTCDREVYFCHTPRDTCVNDSDCGSYQKMCDFDPGAGHWACVPICIPPP